MKDILNKTDRAAIFRARLAQGLATRAISKSELARLAKVDRSTITQILSDDGDRLPNAHLVAACAAALSVSADWLLGLADRPELLADLMAAALTLTEAPRAPVDDTILAWHREAAGYKIRHVPATLPDMLKTRALMQWEYDPQPGRTADQAIGAGEDNLAWLRSSRSDYEIALPLHEITSFARAEGYYRGIPVATRLRQIDHLLDLYRQLYPTMRLYLFDARRVFSAPLTIFGPLLAAVYLGRNYIVFRDRARVDAMSAHFDWLVREAVVGARDLPEVLADLRADAEKG
ncbi:MAG: helix-turn-helix domain-containing protein [Proteobacteria bacterium]|nr:helix-turn-helix domain-containing protein [Pseudomonadota bacterium]MBS0572764.1 helix-turn-helix domain-containing protein [Pseudomonadota bacterium]